MSTRNIVLQFTNFTFSPTDRAFLADHIESQYAPKAKQLNATIRQWLRERSYGTQSNVHYDLRSNVEDGATTRVTERGSVTDLANDVITVEMLKVHKDSVEELTHVVTPEEGLRMIDSTLAFHNHITDKKHIAILSSLRPLLRDIIFSADQVRATVTGDRCWDFQFILPDGGESAYVSVIHLTVHYHNFMGEC